MTSETAALVYHTCAVRIIKHLSLCDAGSCRCKAYMKMMLYCGVHPKRPQPTNTATDENSHKSEQNGHTMGTNMHGQGGRSCPLEMLKICTVRVKC